MELKEFEKFLIRKGLKETTSKGKRSTVYDYLQRVKKVCEKENIPLNELANNIEQFVKDYDKNGCKEELGNKSHRAVINALKKFYDFTKER